MHPGRKFSQSLGLARGASVSTILEELVVSVRKILFQENDTRWQHQIKTLKVQYKLRNLESVDEKAVRM